MQRIYLAGPEVFLPDNIAVFEAKKALCKKYGFEGVSPFDADLDPLRIDNTMETGIRIAGANEDLIESCDTVIANITPFRGPNADPGTVFEIGYARGLGKLIYAYSHGKGLHVERISQLFEGTSTSPKGFTKETLWGTHIDDFNMLENAMIDGGVLLSGGTLLNLYVPGDPPTQLKAMDGLESCLRILTS